MAKFRAWLEDVQDEEAGLGGVAGDDAELAFLPAWARRAVDSFDESLERTEGYLAETQEQWTPPWLSGESARASARATLDASRTFRAFVATLLIACGLFLLAFFVGLPVLVIRPQKFALCFTLGSVTFMASFGVLRGVKAQLRTLCAVSRLPFTLAYVATMAATLWAACLRRSYVLTILCAALQLTTLLYYLGSYVPGGARGVRLFLRAVYRTAALMCRPLCFACTRCCGLLLR